MILHAMNDPWPVTVPDPAAPVLIIDADRRFSGTIAADLARFGYRVEVAHTGPSGLAKALTQPYLAIILDVVLPGSDGFDLLARIRRSSTVPILIVADRVDETNEIAGLECGADDYLSKAASTRQLLARLHAIIRRAAPSPANFPGGEPEGDLTVAELRILPRERKVILDGRTLALTWSEYEILLCLVKARGRVKSRDGLFAEVFNRKYGVFDRSLDMQVSALRRKLGDDPHRPRYIRTVRSVGYLFMNPSRRLFSDPSSSLQAA